MLISVVMPVYNASEFLKRSIESVLKQSYRQLELILVDDGSTDRSKAICRQYAQTDRRVRVFSQKNLGPAGARNTGVRQAKGEFIFFLDADDYLKKDTFKTLIAGYQKYQPDLVMSNFAKLDRGKIVRQSVCFTPDGEPFTGRIKVLSRVEIADFVRHFLKHPSNHLISYCWTRLYQASIIKKYRLLANEKMRLFEDFVFNLDYLRHTDKLLFINQPLYTYVMHDVSASMRVIKAGSLLHDMKIFGKKAGEFLAQAEKEIGHCLTHYLIIFLVRSCRQINQANRKKIYREIKKVINAPITQESLPGYSPAKGQSWLLPWLIKFKLVGLIMLVCQYKAYKRYGKPKNN